MDEKHEDNEDLEFVTFEELKGIAERHIENGHDKYTDVEFEEIIKWVQDVRLNEILLNLVMEGELDLSYDIDRPDDGILFSGKSVDKEIKKSNTILNLDFGEENDNSGMD